MQNALRARMQAGASRGIPARPIIVIVLILIFSTGFISFILYGFISPLFSQPHQTSRAVAVASSPAVWKPKLPAVPIPETPAAGQFRGTAFSVTRAVYANKKLSLRDGSGSDSRYFVITLNLSPEALSGKSYDLSSTGTTGLPEIKMTWHSGIDNSISQPFSGGYALKLNFGNRVKNKIPAKIYLCLPDADKSYLAGTFDVTIAKPKKGAPDVENPTDN